MQDHAAVFRTQDVVDKGCTKMHQVADSINDIKVTVRLSRLVNAQKHP
jgi:succinate dehydrogenase/fumarate reductase flavoprotein subunit